MVYMKIRRIKIYIGFLYFLIIQLCQYTLIIDISCQEFFKHFIYKMKPLRKLQPVFTKKYNDEKYLQKIEQSVTTMANCMAELAKQINKFTSQSMRQHKIKTQQSINNNHPGISVEQQNKKIESGYQKYSINTKQSRYQYVNIPFTKIQGISKQKRMNQIMEWFGKVCKEVLSVGFYNYQNQEPQVNKIKAYCSENILRNLLQFSIHNKLTSQQFQIINQSLCRQILPYFCLKYPQTQQQEVNLTFANELLEKNNIEENSNDLIYKSGVKFRKQESGNYNSQIMEFLNFIIKLPAKVINVKGEQSKQQITIADKFIKDMENLFRKVQTQTNTINMKKFDPKLPSKVLHLIQEKQSQKEKQLYMEKVRSYTSFQIGRKLSQNFRQFTQIQIKSGALKLTNVGIMRIISKWCEQLWNCFNQQFILERENQFRMKDGSQKFMKKYYIAVLNLLLQKQKKTIIQGLKQIESNNCQQQSYFSQQQVSQKLLRFSKQEAIVGQFTSVMFKNYENYLINYLNLLIHGINKASQNFQKFVKVATQKCWILPQFQIKFDNQSLDKNDIQQIMKKVNNEQFQEPVQTLSKIPQLITFKIGDLLRCKCSSKQSQIIAIYKQLQRLSYVASNQIKIIRVKNRLDKGSKDILINAMYKQVMLVQIQLSIKAEKSKFVAQSNSFNHYLYELKRSEFGPISEMCSIWVNRDLRSPFYLSQLEKTNKRMIIKREQVQNQKLCHPQKQNLRIIRLPFICDTCKCFYYDCSFTEKHISCQICQKKTCFLCQIQSLPIKQKFQLLPQIKFRQQIKLENIKFLSEVPQTGGALLNIKSKIRKTRIFKTIYFNNEWFIFQNNGLKNSEKQLKIRFIKSFKGKQLPSQFLKQNILFTSPEIEASIPPITLQIAQQQYFIPNYLKQSYKAHKNSIALIKIHLSQKIFTDDKNIWPSIKKLNFSQNQFVNIDKLYNKFPNSRLSVLSFNRIQQISEEVIKWENIKSLFLQNNKIKQIHPNIGKLKMLQELELSHNQLKQLPNQIGQLLRLRDLNLDCNHIQYFPQDIGKLQQLQKLNFANNLVKNLPESFGNLKSLKKLWFFHNPLQSLPQSFGRLSALQVITGFQCKLARLPDNIGLLKNLVDISLFNNSLQSLSESFGLLSSLKKLNVQCNQIQKLPNDLSGLTSLENINMYNNKLHNLPESIGYLTAAKQIYLSSNQIQKIPDSIGNLQKLQILGLSSNLLTEINVNICNLTELRQLTFEDNQIQKIPQQISNLKKLVNVSFSANKLTNDSIPESLKALKQLIKLGISQNKLDKFPQFITEMSWLKNLYLTVNQIKQVPASLLGLKNLTQFEIDKDKLDQQSKSTVQKIEQRAKLNQIIYQKIQEIEQTKKEEQI